MLMLSTAMSVFNSVSGQDKDHDGDGDHSGRIEQPDSYHSYSSKGVAADLLIRRRVWDAVVVQALHKYDAGVDGHEEGEKQHPYTDPIRA